VLLGKKVMRESQNAGPFGSGGFPVGRYVTVPSEKDPVVWLISDPLANVEPKPDRWLRKDFIRVEKPKSIAVTATEPDQAWKLVRETETGDWNLADRGDLEILDKSKTVALNSVLSYASFTDVKAADAEDVKEAFQGARTIDLNTFDGFQYLLTVGNEPSGENYLVKIGINANYPRERVAAADETAEDKERLDKDFQERLKKLDEKLKQEKECDSWVYVVSKWTVDPLLKNRADLLLTAPPDDDDHDDDHDHDDEDSLPLLPKGAFDIRDLPALPPVPDQP
jgi:hypothetical protein